MNYNRHKEIVQEWKPEYIQYEEYRASLQSFLPLPIYKLTSMHIHFLDKKTDVATYLAKEFNRKYNKFPKC